MMLDTVFEAVDWYALRVAPGRERLAAVAVSRLGALSYLPGYRSWVRRSRRAKHLTLKEHPLAAGYLFVGFTPGWIQVRGWKRFVELDLVVGVLSRTQRSVGEDGREVFRRDPCRLPRTWMLGTGFENLLEAAAPAEPVYDYGPGDDVLITHDAFDRHPAKCIAIEGDHARVLVELFGSQMPMTIDKFMAVKAN